jgi:fucose 4-O-acetylase-like acetyltransferase
MDVQPNSTRQEDTQKRALELYDQHRQQAWQDIQSSTDSFDNNLLTFSTAALGLSLAFIKDIVPLDAAVWLRLLYASWIAFTGCILVTLASFQVSISAQKKYLEYLHAYYVHGDESAFDKQKRSFSSRALTCMTWLAAICFLCGVTATMAFCCKNVSRRASMSESKTTVCKEGRAPVTMTPVPAQPTPTASQTAQTGDGGKKKP